MNGGIWSENATGRSRECLIVPAAGGRLPHVQRRETPENSATRHFFNQHNMDMDMEIKNPRRILAIGAPGAGVLPLLKGT